MPLKAHNDEQMLAELPQQLILLAVVAFLLGWILASASARMGSGSRSRKRDPRDDRIRSLEAEQRVASTEIQKLRDKLSTRDSELADANEGIEKRDSVISQQQSDVDTLKRDLKDSVKKTRELRHELSDRATESLRSEVKQRELETELSVAQASTDLIATGVLDYSLSDDDGDESAANGLAELDKSAS